ncbi:MAG: hypothetical protein OXC93_07690 [Rhodospirillaceae bacterium]|nr:hypothetical protein [Rhodospirillaceae bacterium]
MAPQQGRPRATALPMRSGRGAGSARYRPVIHRSPRCGCWTRFVPRRRRTGVWHHRQPVCEDDEDGQAFARMGLAGNVERSLERSLAPVWRAACRFLMRRVARGPAA